MKKLLFAFCLSLMLTSLSAQQSLNVHYSAWTTIMGTTYLSNQPVWVHVAYSGITAHYAFTTNSNGNVNDSIPHPGTAAIITFITYDCQGNAITSSKNISPSNTWVADTGIVPCGVQLNCNAMIHILSGTSGLTLSLLDSSSLGTPTSANIIRHSEWDFGDGNYIQKINDPTVNHTYSQPGTYNVCLLSTLMDTLNNVVLCMDTVCMPFTVGGGNPAFCTAAYSVDTASSGAGNLIVWNNSVPAYNNTNYLSTYSWDFGDGGTSSQPFPSHTYANPGLYQVCVTITSVDGNNLTCTDTYCDSVGLDANGNLLYKTTGGFSLNVLDPATIGLENLILKEVQIFPNPAYGETQVDLGNLTGAVNWKLFDLKGAQFKAGTETSDKLSLDVSNLNSGVYILSLETSTHVSNHKLIVK